MSLVYFDKAIATDVTEPRAAKIAEERIQAMAGMDNWEEYCCNHMD